MHLLLSQIIVDNFILPFLADNFNSLFIPEIILEYSFYICIQTFQYLIYFYRVSFSCWFTCDFWKWDNTCCDITCANLMRSIQRILFIRGLDFVSAETESWNYFKLIYFVWFSFFRLLSWCDFKAYMSLNASLWICNLNFSLISKPNLG